MRKIINKLFLNVIVFLLVFSTVFVNPINAKEFDLVNVVVKSLENDNIYEVIKYDGDLFFKASDYSEITNYKYQKSENIGYTLGKKIIIIDPKTGKMQIPVLGYDGKVGEILVHENEYYISASKLLPWLNVTVSVDNGDMVVIPDEKSFWEIIDGMDYSDYMFNLYEEYGDYVGNVVGLTAMTVFDTILNLRWDDLIPADGIDGAAKNASLYDYKCYINVLSEIGSDEVISENTGKDIIDNTLSINGLLEDIEDDLGVDSKELGKEFKELINDSGLNTVDAQNISDFIDVYNGTRDIVKSYEDLTKYIDLFKIMKMTETILKTDKDYVSYLKWLRKKDTGNNLLNKAIDTAYDSLSKDYGGVQLYFMDELGDYFSSLPGDFVEELTKKSVDPSDLSEMNLNNGFFASLSSYMFISKIIFNTILPVADGFEGMAKVGVNESIQDYSWNLANNLLLNEEKTADNLLYMRQSYLMALKTSKMCYEAMDETMTSFSWLNGEGLLNYKLENIDKKIIELTYSIQTNLNDSIDGKDDKRIKNVIKKVKITKEDPELTRMLKYSSEEIFEKLIKPANSAYLSSGYGIDEQFCDSFEGEVLVCRFSDETYQNYLEYLRKYFSESIVKEIIGNVQEDERGKFVPYSGFGWASVGIVEKKMTLKEYSMNKVVYIGEFRKISHESFKKLDIEYEDISIIIPTLNDSYYDDIEIKEYILEKIENRWIFTKFEDCSFFNYINIY